MSDEYTPTTEDIREQVAWQFEGDAEKRAEEAFDRWLAAHDAQVNRTAFDDRDAALERLAHLSRLHEVATERTVELAAVIQAADAMVSAGTVNAAKMHDLLRSADTAAVLREHDEALIRQHAQTIAESNRQATVEAIIETAARTLEDAANQIHHRQHAESIRQMLTRRAAAIRTPASSEHNTTKETP